VECDRGGLPIKHDGTYLKWLMNRNTPVCPHT
jgi:hypothetical protein